MRINKIQINEKEQMKMLYMATLVLLLPIFASLYFFYDRTDKSDEIVETQIETTTPHEVNLQIVPTAAHAAIVVSLNNDKILYQKFPDKQLPLASITKLVTAKVASDQNPLGTVAIEKMDPPTYGDSKLNNGDLWQKNELIAYTLITSSNDGAHSLSSNNQTSTAFVDKMNLMAASIGLADTYFYNETGLDNDYTGVPGSKGTAKDISKLLSYLLKNDLPLYEETKYKTAYIESPTGITTASNTNEFTDKITGLLLSKTGYTDIAGGNLAIVADMGLNEPTAFVILKSSKDSRFDDVIKLQEEYFAQVVQAMR